ncbi:hypothetical protein F8M41_025250 [Gigaspora margarita]|uniref:Uncharacterized protein n=1 Tax=Gigaspora margarita TaxID=4874 RepID=A0A8H3XKH8_GIGMA|nr:hypothetical protein F8M41_025250 [Gigaspora margarita]
MKAISRIYDYAFDSSEMIDKFKIEDLPELSAHFIGKSKDPLSIILKNYVNSSSHGQKDQEILGNKRKFEQAGLDNYPEVIFGIVTSGTIWRFIRVSGPLKSLKIEITAEYNSGLTSIIENMNYDYAKEVLCCIVRVLQAQVVNYSKRPSIDYISG